VERTHTVVVYHQMAHIITVGQTSRRAVVASGQNAPVAHNHRANMGAVTGAAFRHSEGYVQKVVIPGWPLARSRLVGCQSETPSYVQFDRFTQLIVLI
jgi:hypothetical protein